MCGKAISSSSREPAGCLKLKQSSTYFFPLPLPSSLLHLSPPCTPVLPTRPTCKEGRRCLLSTYYTAGTMLHIFAFALCVPTPTMKLQISTRRNTRDVIPGLSLSLYGGEVGCPVRGSDMFKVTNLFLLTRAPVCMCGLGRGSWGLGLLRHTTLCC